MAQQANKMLVGGFIVCAVVILAASVVLFGSGKFFRDTVEFALVFDDSVKGLNDGSPVLFKGVQVGSVRSLKVVSDQDQGTTYIPVIIEIFPDKFCPISRAGKSYVKDKMARLIELGLRAQLVSRSLVTGQLAIEVELHPQRPAKLKNLEIIRDYIEIPTIPSTAERFAQALGKLDLEKLEENIASILGGIDKLVNSPKIAATLAELRALFNQTGALLARVDQRLDPLADNLSGTIDSYRKLADNLDRQLTPVITGANRTIDTYEQMGARLDLRLESLITNLELTVAETTKVLKDAHAVLAEDASLLVHVDASLEEFTGAARSLRLLTEYLRRHPEALLRGKGQPEE
ncbi:MAG: MCE family protein [Deltaproteobacteria bacterium]|nr:MCE family protein [Deltaproteobacteria bacterium]